MISDALAHWLLVRSDRGISSDTMVKHLTGYPLHLSFADVPADPSDFGRCERLLRNVPELRDQLPRMAELGDDWAALVEHWDDIVAVCEDEVPGCFDSKNARGSAPRAYDLIHWCRSHGSRWSA